MDKELKDFEKSFIDSGIGDVTVMSKEDISKMIDNYQSMTTLMKVQNVRECTTDNEKIKFLIRRGDVLYLQEARNMLEKCPFYFINQSSVVIPEGQDLEDSENYIFHTDGMYIKVTKYMGNMTIMREAFIGIMGLNFLRTYIPNFSCIIGVWRYQRPIIYRDLNGEYDIAYTVGPKLISDYVAYEEIKGVSLHKYIKLFKGEGLKNILWQICNALKLAYQTCGFYHGDLHYENIIISPKNHTYIYSEEGETKCFETNMIPVMIDYGISVVTYQDTQYSKISDLNDENKALYEYKDVVYPVRDITHLIGFLATENKRIEIIKEIDQKYASSIKKWAKMIRKSYTMKDFDIFMLELSPDSTEQILPYVAGGKKFIPKEVKSLDEYIKQINLLEKDVNNYEEEDEAYLGKIESYGSCMLSLLADKSFKYNMIKNFKGKLIKMIDLLQKMFLSGYKGQLIYDLYLSLSQYV